MTAFIIGHGRYARQAYAVGRIQGPQGPQGIQGIQGPVGPQGPAGPGLSEINYLDTVENPIALYNFDETLADFSGNGLDLSVDTGSIFYSDIVPNKKALNIRAARLTESTLNPLLNIVGDVTVICIIQIDGIFTSAGLVTWGGPTDSEADNVTYSARVNTAAFPYTMQWFTEHGAGINDSFNGPTSSGSVVLPPVHNIMFVGYTRISDVITFNLNGHNTVSSGVLPTPTGGSTGQFWVGNYPANDFFQGLIMSIKVLDKGYTATQFKDEYNRSLGAGYGLIP